MTEANGSYPHFQAGIGWWVKFWVKYWVTAGNDWGLHIPPQVRYVVLPVMMTSSNGNIFRVTGHLCGDSPVPGEFPTQRPVTRSFDVFFDQRLNKRLSKQPWGWWFETPAWSLWRHHNDMESHCKDKAVVRPFCLHSMNPYALKDVFYICEAKICFVITLTCVHYKVLMHWSHSNLTYYQYFIILVKWYHPIQTLNERLLLTGSDRFYCYCPLLFI